MLLQLNVSNYADRDLTLEFCLFQRAQRRDRSGKSIIIGALGLLLGERATNEEIRQGEERALLEAMFAVIPAEMPAVDKILDEAGLPAGEELIISREISRSGRSICRVNGRTVPLLFLKSLGQHLVDLHGQHEHQSLLHPEQHLALLDAFGGEELAGSRRKAAGFYQKIRELTGELETLGHDSAQRERRMDVLKYQIKEITAAGLTGEEEEELLAQERILAHSEKLTTSLLQAYTGLFAGDESMEIVLAADRLHEAGLLVRRLPPSIPVWPRQLILLQSISTQLQELSLGSNIILTILSLIPTS